MKRLLRRWLIACVLLTGLSISSVNAQGRGIDNLSGKLDPGTLSSLSNSNVTPSVDKYTGRLMLTIPLYTITTNDGFSLPISLNYNASGHRVADYSSEAGLGWDLSYSCKVTRIRMGSFMDNDIIWGYKWMDDYIDLISNKSAQGRINDFKYSSKEQMDTEADIYQFEIPGASGFFFRAADGKYYTIPYSPIKIKTGVQSRPEGSTDPAFIYFMLTDANGYTYHFGEVPEASVLGEYRAKSRPKPGGSGTEKPYLPDHETPMIWLPVRITNNGANIISFTYESDPNQLIGSYNMRYQHLDTDEPWNQWDVGKDLYLYSPKRISKITWGDDKNSVEFNYKSVKADDRDMKLYSSIDVNLHSAHANRKTFSFILSHSTFQSGRPKLDKIETEYDNDLSTLVSFGYEEEVNLPKRSGYDYDYWGYYNGANNNGYEPEHITYDASGNEIYVSGASREPNFQYTVANILKKVIYPTGGFLQFQYEPHTATAVVKGQYVDNLVFGGVRIKAVQQYSDAYHLVSEKRYSYTSEGSTNSCGIGYKYPDKYAKQEVGSYKGGWYSVFQNYHYKLTDYNGAAVVYPRVTEHYSNGSYSVTEYYSYEDFSDLPAKPFEGARYNTNCGEYYNLEKNDMRVDLEGAYPPTPFFWARGMEKSVTSYSADGEQVSKVTNQYELLGAPKATLTGLIFDARYPEETDYSDEVSYYWGIGARIGTYKWISQAIALTKTIQEQGPYNLRTEISYEYDTITTLPIKTVTVNANNDRIEERVKYNFDYADIQNNDTSAFASAMLFYKNQHIFQPVEQYVIKNGKVVSGEVLTFTENWAIRGETPSYEGAKYVPHKKFQLFASEPISDYQETYYDANGFHMDPRYEEVEAYESYDGHNRVLTVTRPYGYKKSYIYEHNQIVAEVENAAHYIVEWTPDHLANKRHANQVYYSGFEILPYDFYDILQTDKAKSGEIVGLYSFFLNFDDFANGTYVISYWVSKDFGETWEEHVDHFEVTDDMTDKMYSFHMEDADHWFDEVRVMPLGAKMKTYAFNPLFGVCSEIDVNGRGSHRRYDSQGRLVKIMNNDWDVLKEYEYNIVTKN